MRFHPNQTKHQQAMRMSKFSIELLLGVSVKISHQQIGSISTLLFECLVFLFRSPNIQIAFFFSDNDFCIWFYHAMSVWIQVFQVLLIGFVWDSFVDSDSDIFWWSQAQWHDNEYEGDRFCYRYSFVSDQGGLREACGYWLVHQWHHQATASFYTRVENDLWAFILANLLWNSFISDWQILS